ncbi:hypothetical protein [Gracilimonas halophila]|uniref:Uncharacterized protein n=1 Tax=Gracilimonas halophila TaxID=1834464 RepID=A0ABW5JNA9_9BACT
MMTKEVFKKKPSKVFWGFIIIVLICINMYSLYIVQNKNKMVEEVVKMKNNTADTLNSVKNSVRENKFFEINENGKTINDELILNFGSDDRTNIKFESLLVNKYTYVIDLGHLDCFSCMQGIKNILNPVTSFINNYGSKVVLLAEYRTQEDIEVLRRLTNLEVEIYSKNGNKLGLEIEDNITPYILILDKNLMVNNVFVPIEKFPELTSLYFTYTGNIYD